MKEVILLIAGLVCGYFAVLTGDSLPAGTSFLLAIFSAFFGFVLWVYLLGHFTGRYNEGKTPETIAFMTATQFVFLCFLFGILASPITAYDPWP